MAFHEPEIVAPDGSAAMAQAGARPATLAEFLVLAFMIAAFAYEIPLVYVTNFYKANPYLFDVAAITLTSYWLLSGRARGWSVSLDRNPMLKPWFAITMVFVVCTLAAGAWIPFNYWIKSIWFMLKYLEGLIVLLLFFSAPMDAQLKRRLLWVALLGGTWVAAVAVLQFLGIVSSTRVIPKGWEIAKEGKGIYSTLGFAYFHTGFFGVVSTLVGLALFASSRGFARILAGILAGFCTIPAIVSGSRAAFLGLVISLGVLATRPKYRKQIGTYLMAGVMVASITYFYARSYTRERTVSRSYQISASARFTHGFTTIADELSEHGPRFLLFGGGFMSAPLRGHYRSGYGVHNMHLFPLEQGGLGAFGLAIWMWSRMGIRLGRGRHSWPTNALDESLRSAMFSFLVAALLVGFSGTSFWMRNGMVHFTFYELLLWGLALTVTGQERAPVPREEPVQSRFSLPAFDREIPPELTSPSTR